jgi:hypothetical protein
VNTLTTIEVLLETVFLFGPCKAVIKKKLFESRHSSSGVQSEQLIESWTLLWEAEKMALCSDVKR